MTENTKPQPKKKKKLSRSAWIVIIGCCIILIPLLVFGGIILHSALTNHAPVIGNRFNGDLDPAITKENQQAIQTAVSSLSDVEKVDVQLTTAQLRINVDVKDTMSEEECTALAQKVYEEVNKVCPVSTYFTSTDTRKMYDLSVNVYNFVDSENEEMVYVIVTKNSKMSEPSVQTVSSAVNPELAAQLRGDNEEDDMAGTTGGVEPTVEPSEESEE